MGWEEFKKEFDLSLKEFEIRLKYFSTCFSGWFLFFFSTIMLLAMHTEDRIENFLHILIILISAFSFFYFFDQFWTRPLPKNKKGSN